MHNYALLLKCKEGKRGRHKDILATLRHSIKTPEKTILTSVYIKYF